MNITTLIYIIIVRIFDISIANNIKKDLDIILYTTIKFTVLKVFVNNNISYENMLFLLKGVMTR